MRPLRQLLVVSAVTLSVLFAAAAPARAQQAPESAPAAGYIWYGGPSLALDAGALALLIGGAQADGRASDALITAAIGTYLLGAPIVHAANGEYGRALGSLVLRVGVPVGTFYVVATAVGCEDDSDDCLGPFFVGLFGAMIATGLTVAIDDFGLARKSRPVQPSWAPSVAPTSTGGMTFGVVGRF